MSTFTESELTELERLLNEVPAGPLCVHPNGTSAWYGTDWDTVNNSAAPQMALRAAGTSLSHTAELELAVDLRNALPELLALARETKEAKLREFRSAVMFDIRATYPRHSLGMSDEAVLGAWFDGVKARGWNGKVIK